MNWDWEKLQEKRQKPGRGRMPGGPNPFSDFKVGDFFSRFTGGGLPLGIICAVALVGWAASGIFIVRPGEIGVITRFGEYSREVGDGPHYHLPYPVEETEIVAAESLRTVVIGQTPDGGVRSKSSTRNSGEEASMFTGDENIVHMRFNVQYNISRPRDYLFKVRDPETTIRLAAEAAMREVVGRSNIDSILTAGRAETQVQALQVLENILAPYNIGVRIHTVQLLDVQPPPEVEAAFKDVASAREDRVRIINEAEAYRMKIVPVANGTAQGMLNAAEAYGRQVEQAAEGEAERFRITVREYNKARDVTRKRMYLEAMGDVLSSTGLEKIIISRDAEGNILPLLNLDGRAAGSREKTRNGGAQ
ncbi:MAG: FtsH protease activity modulator HflK [Desulfovibrio sp.]|nr:FtsH protease activity modulator HflK [Desulfovibrio sp.]